MFVPFPFNMQTGRTGLTHSWLGYQKRLLNQKRDLYVTEFIEQAQIFDLIVEAVTDEKVCNICGFDIVRLILQNAWELETCSAYGTKDSAAKACLLARMHELSLQSAYNRGEEKSIV